MSKRLAVCLLLINDENKILAVSRRNTIDDWGLVGGKLDNNESLEEAIVRETKEETNLTINKQYLYPIYKRIDNEFEVVTFGYSGFYDTAEIKQGDAGIVAWVSWEELIASSFGNYNQALFDYILENGYNPCPIQFQKLLKKLE